MGYTACTFRRWLNGIDIDIVMPVGTIGVTVERGRGERGVAGVFRRITGGTVDGLGRAPSPLYHRLCIIHPVYRFGNAFHLNITPFP